MKRWRWILGGLAALLVLLAGVSVAVLRSDWFSGQVRAKIVAETERASGGQAALESFSFDWRTLTAAVRGFVLRGREPAGSEPLFSAHAIELKLTVLSWLSRDIRLRSLTLDKPRVRIVVYPDGTTNLPHPKVPRKQGNPLEELMRLKIARIDLRHGWIQLDQQSLPFDVRASGLELQLGFDAANKRYRTNASIADVQLPEGYRSSLELAGWLETRRLLLETASARAGESRLSFSGEVVFSPFEIRTDYEGRFRLADIPQLGIGRGEAAISGRLALVNGRVAAAGNLNASGIALTAAGVNVEQASLKSSFDLRPDVVQLRGLSFSTAFGRGEGEATISHWKSLDVSAVLTGVDVEKVQRVLLDKPYAWSGTAGGPVTLKAAFGKGGLVVEDVAASMEVEPAEGAVPVGGSVSVAWNRRDKLLKLDGTSLTTRSSRLNVRGVLGRELDASLLTTSIRDIEPVVALLSRDQNFALPLRIENGEARIDAKVLGPLGQPRISGNLSLRNARVDEAPFDSLDTRFEVSEDKLVLSGLALKQQDASLKAGLSVQLRDWKADWSSPVVLSLRVEHAEVQRVLGLFRVKSPVSGVFDGTVEARGPAGAPALNVRISGSGARMGNENVRKISLALATESNGDFRGKIALDAMTGELSGRLRHVERDFQNGSATINLKTSNLRLSEIEDLQGEALRTDGLLSADLTVALAYSPAGIKWTGIDGSVTAPEIRVNDRRLVMLDVRSATGAGGADLTLKCAIRGESGQFLNARARLNLDGEPLLEGHATFPRMSFAFLRSIASPPPNPGAPAREPLPVRGFLEGEAKYSVNLKQLGGLKTLLTIHRLQLRPGESQLLETQIDPSELLLSNSSPVVIEIDGGRVTVRPASFSAKETKLSLSGSAGLKENAPLNLRLTGSANLALLSTFRPDVEASGRADVDASIRGTPADPSLSGRMTISRASFFLKDLPNGIENANGTVYFEKNRANIEKLSGQTGGGEFLITGFLGINQGEFNYRLNAKGSGIRIRYPEGVSTTADASLDLVGTPARSLLSGTVTVLKSGFIGGGDLGEMVGGASNPIPPPATRNEFLRNLQFDVKIRTAPDATLVSSYTEGLETEANLQLRGSPSKPVLLGSVEVNQGTIRFFGNRYTISRGELLFYNTAVVQPTIDLDLETRIRGVTVYINVSGPLARLNVNYRSEPPLQSNEILALLTVGRTPAAAGSSLQATSTIRNQNILETTSSNSLLGGALSAGISGRVERFFGASRIKIDPQATGVDNVAQARLSIEQSLSRDVTVTFVTNLSRTQEQIVRVEWDVSRQWQVIAVRDENGIFAVDFIYRTRFK